MQSTHIPPVICTRCGWHNEAGARMCGGCGQPLSAVGATPVSAPSTPRHADGSPITSTSDSGDAPTAYTPGGAYDYGAAGMSPQPTAAPARWPAQAQRPQPAYALEAQPTKRRGRSCLQRAMLTLLTLVVVTSCCGVGLWSFVLRPALHTATDNQIRTGLDNMFDQASNTLEVALPQLPQGTYRDSLPITAADINAKIQGVAAKKSMPSGSEVHFIGSDGIQVTYLLAGKPHTVTTHVYVVNGRLRARNTTDDFPLSAWESNDELETTINEALTHLTPDLHITELHMANDTLHFTFTK